MYASTWGDPSAAKRVLLIHGLSASSQTWHRTAHEFVSRGYFVTAPDLLGHGSARRSSDYTVAALAQALSPYLKSGEPYHIVVGHSLGGVVAAALLPLLEATRPVHVVLVDPPLEQPPESVASMRRFLGDQLRNPKTPDAYLQEWPQLTPEGALFRYMSTRLCDVAAVEGILDQNVPWSFLRLLSMPPDNVRVTVLAADPSEGACVREEQLEAYPHVTVKTLWGFSHMIPLEAPQVIVETAVEGAETRG